MANFVEIIGAPGVGKTTLYKALCKFWKPGLNWIYPELLIIRKPSSSEFTKWLEYLLRKLFGKTLHEFPIDLGLRFSKNNPVLANFLWNHLTNTYCNQEINKRFRATYYVLEDFSKYQAIIESNSRKPCLVCEGLLQKSFLLNDDYQNSEKILNEYLSLIPKPQAIIYVDTIDAETILKRLRKRKKTIFSQIGMNDKELLSDIKRWKHTLSRISAKMEEYKIPTIKIDGEHPVDYNVTLINQVLDLNGTELIKTPSEHVINKNGQVFIL